MSIGVAARSRCSAGRSRCPSVGTMSACPAVAVPKLSSRAACESVPASDWSSNASGVGTGSSGSHVATLEPPAPDRHVTGRMAEPGHGGRRGSLGVPAGAAAFARVPDSVQANAPVVAGDADDVGDPMLQLNTRSPRGASGAEVGSLLGRGRARQGQPRCVPSGGQRRALAWAWAGRRTDRRRWLSPCGHCAAT